MLADVAIDDALLAEGTEVAVARVALAQGLVREVLVAVDDTPELGVLRLAVDRLVIEVNTTRSVVVLQEIVRPGVVELLGEKTLASDGVPVPPRSSPLNTIGRVSTLPAIAFSSL